MTRYTGVLYKLVEEAGNDSASKKDRSKSKSSSRATWSKVYKYLEAHSFNDANVKNPAFDSPLPPFTAPSESLNAELLESSSGSRNDSTILRLAVCVAPAMIVASLCHLQPKAANIADSQGRLPLHFACRRSAKDPEVRAIFEVLIAAYTPGLVHRDHGGRSPLHYLFAYHAPHRTPEVVELFCQKLPENAFAGIKQGKLTNADTNADADTMDEESLRFPLPEIPTPSQQQKVPPTAAIIHDAIEGALPLHYAVVKGATRDVLRILLDAYQESKCLGDRKGRTALALYFGAGMLDADPKNVKNLNGEPIDPNDKPWWDNKLESATIKLLLSSKVARTADYTGRYPIHWACALLGKHYYASAIKGTCLSLKAIQLLKDNHVEALVLGDLAGKTPLHLFFDSVRDHQQMEWKRLNANNAVRDNIDLVKGGPSAFEPPMQLVELMLSDAGEERSAVFIEDNAGRLPIHAALEVATSADVVKFLIGMHPASLVHATEEQLVSPLHSALISPIVAPLQTRETIELVLEAYVASRHGTYVDGRLALKMEDADGNYPIHYACRNQACLDVVKMFVDKYPKSCLFQNADGDLPLHSILDVGFFGKSKNGKSSISDFFKPSEGWQSSKEKHFHNKQFNVMQKKIQLLIDPLLAAAESTSLLKIGSSAHGMLPLHVAVAFGATPYSTIYTMLDRCPETVSKVTGGKDKAYSTLDLHQTYWSTYGENESGTEKEIEWQNIRELLFSFHPLDGNHRHDEDLLAQCVRLVRSEIKTEGSYHMTELRNIAKQSPIPPLKLTETFTSIEVPEETHGGRPLRSRKKNRGIKKSKSGIKSSPSMKSSGKSHRAEKAPKSIYDDDALDFEYVVSEGSSDDDVYDDSFSGPESAEEYLSDEFEEKESFDDDENIEVAWNPAVAAGKLLQSGASKEEKFETNQEEKKEDVDVDEVQPDDQSMFSEVALRIFSFFMLYCDPKTPSDNYSQQVESILDDVSRSLVETIISLPAPTYALHYLGGGVRLEGLSLRELASPKSREIIKKLFYFLGRFDFSSETSGILLHRNSNNSTVLVRATEWTFSTEEYNDAPKVDPGVVEAEIWETGVIPAEKVGYMGSTFRAMRRNVCFMFTKDAGVYRNELQCRSDLGVATEGGNLSKTHVIPLLTHFNAQGIERSEDRYYKVDINNDAFSTLNLFGNTNKVSHEESICLSDYPFALVFPYSNYGDLFDYFFRHGVEGHQEIREICSQVGKTLRRMHEKGIVHGNVCMRDIALFPPTPECEEEADSKHWALTNFSGAFRINHQKCYLGAICHQGNAYFHSSSLPPEMFVKLSNADLRMYNDYWDAVEHLFDVKVDRSVIKPVIDFSTGVSYVIRCHYVPSGKKLEIAKRLPPLPYKLSPARESADIWALGQLLFMLCSSGRPLFPTNARTGHLLNYREISRWDKQAAENMIYEHVQDPLAQDILLRLLSPYEERSSFDMKTALSHPFFQTYNNSILVEKIGEQRKQSSDLHIMSLRNKVLELSDGEWLRERTTSVECWDFEVLTRFHLSPTTLAPEIMSRCRKQSSMPCSFILLPYRLSMNKKSKLTPGTKKDVERAEQVGIKILSLCKACHFVTSIKRAVAKEKFSTRIWCFSEMLEKLNLPSDDFSDLTSEMSQLAAHYVELFRYDPLSVGVKLVQAKIREFLSCFEGAKKTWLYLVDEYTGVPVVASATDIFPHVVREDIRDEILKKGLPFMYMCSSYFLGVSGSVDGLVKLIFEAAYPHIPPSWQAVAKGLNHCLDRDSIVSDMEIIRSAMSSMFLTRHTPVSDEDLNFMHDYLLEIDTGRTFAKLQRISGGGASLWTTPDGVKEITRVSESYSFREALNANSKKTEMLAEKEKEIQKLKDELEKLRFRNDLNLEVPDLGSNQEQTQQINVKKDLKIEIPDTAMMESPFESSQDKGTTASSPRKSSLGITTVEQKMPKTSPHNNSSHEATEPISFAETPMEHNGEVALEHIDDTGALADIEHVKKENPSKPSNGIATVERYPETPHELSADMENNDTTYGTEVCLLASINDPRSTSESDPRSASRSPRKSICEVEAVESHPQTPQQLNADVENSEATSETKDCPESSTNCPRSASKSPRTSSSEVTPQESYPQSPQQLSVDVENRDTTSEAKGFPLMSINEPRSASKSPKKSSRDVLLQEDSPGTPKRYDGSCMLSSSKSPRNSLNEKSEGRSFPASPSQHHGEETSGDMSETEKADDLHSFTDSPKQLSPEGAAGDAKCETSLQESNCESSDEKSKPNDDLTADVSSSSSYPHRQGKDSLQESLRSTPSDEAVIPIKLTEHLGSLLGRKSDTLGDMAPFDNGSTNSDEAAIPMKLTEHLASLQAKKSNTSDDVGPFDIDLYAIMAKNESLLREINEQRDQELGVEICIDGQPTSVVTEVNPRNMSLSDDAGEQKYHFIEALAKNPDVTLEKSEELLREVFGQDGKDSTLDFGDLLAKLPSLQAELEKMRSNLNCSEVEKSPTNETTQSSDAETTDVEA